MAVQSASAVKGGVCCIAVTSAPRLLMMALKSVWIVWRAQAIRNHIRQHCDTHPGNSGNLSEGRRGGQFPKVIVDIARDRGDLLDVGHHIGHAQLSSPEAGQHKGGEENRAKHFGE